MFYVGKILLVVIERTTGVLEEDQKGPPFSVPEAEVRNVFQSQSWVSSVELLDDQGESQRAAADTGMRSLYFIITAQK